MKQKGLNVLSLFDGKACAMLVLKKCNIPVNNYYASEIDKNSIFIAHKNHPEIKQIGDVSNIDVNLLPKIDLLVGGSPCQGFSFAGKQLNFEDPRSKLFFEYVRILNEIKKINPDIKFFLENVKMKKEYQDVISKYLGVEPIFVNSSLVSAEVRKRLYWTNIEGFKMPEEKGIVIKDILEDGIDGYGAAIRGRYEKDRTVKQNFEINGTQKLNTITTVKKDSVIAFKTNQINPSKLCKGIQPQMQDRVFHINGKVHCITASFGSRTNIGDFSVDTWRNLTPIEAERAHGLPDNYTQGVSDAQRYKMIGNGWNIDTIVEFFKNLKTDNFGM